jgi:hypothetical protein
MSRPKRVPSPTAVVTPRRDYGEPSRGRFKDQCLVAIRKPYQRMKSRQLTFTKGCINRTISHVKNLPSPFVKGGSRGCLATAFPSRGGRGLRGGGNVKPLNFHCFFTPTLTLPRRGGGNYEVGCDRGRVPLCFDL